MPLEFKLLGILFPLVVLLIGCVKAYERSRADLRRLPRIQQIAVLVTLGVAISIGGTKPQPPGPTISNLKLLIAERNRKLSNGESYGAKADIVEAETTTTATTNEVALAVAAIQALSNTVMTASQAVGDATAGERHYLRLVFPSPLLDAESNLYGETLRCTVTNGTATAFVWFNITPNSVPEMYFTISLGAATNNIATIEGVSVSFPNTVEVDGLACYEFTFPLPAQLLHDGMLYAPLDIEKRVTLGCAPLNKPFNVDGGIAFKANGQYWVGVTGWGNQHRHRSRSLF